MRRLVFVTQAVDPDDPVLAATVPQIRALAGRLDEVVVLTDRAVDGALPPNCRVRTFAAPAQSLRGLRFAGALAPELARRPVAVLAHMAPIYAILAAPLARPLGVPVLLWFTHWLRRRKLELAERLATRVLTVDETSFPFASPKVRAIGHAVDVGRFPCAEPRDGSALRLVALGRYSPAKSYETLARGVGLAREHGFDVTLDVHGPTLTEEERAYRAALADADGVRFHDAVAGSAVPALLLGYDGFASATRAGSADKAILEAAAACLPVLARTTPVDAVLRFEAAEELAERIAELAQMPAAERARRGRAGHDEVRRRHSVDSWADGVLAAL